MERLKHACFMHVSAHIMYLHVNPESFMHESSVIILKFHACYMYDSWNMYVTCRIWDVLQVWDMHGLVPKFMDVSFHAWYICHTHLYFHVCSVMFRAWNTLSCVENVWKLLPCLKHAWEYIPCMETHESRFHAWNSACSFQVGRMGT